jgi:hypothetical protein
LKKIDKDGLLLCELQANAFEMSADSTDVSSEIFIRRFMNSNVASVSCHGIIHILFLVPLDVQVKMNST